MRSCLPPWNRQTLGRRSAPLWLATDLKMSNRLFLHRFLDELQSPYRAMYRTFKQLERKTTQAQGLCTGHDIKRFTRANDKRADGQLPRQEVKIWEEYQWKHPGCWNDELWLRCLRICHETGHLISSATSANDRPTIEQRQEFAKT